MSFAWLPFKHYTRKGRWHQWNRDTTSYFLHISCSAHQVNFFFLSTWYLVYNLKCLYFLQKSPRFPLCLGWKKWEPLTIFLNYAFIYLVIVGSPIIPCGCSVLSCAKSDPVRKVNHWVSVHKMQQVDLSGHIAWPADPPVIPYTSFISLDIPALFSQEQFGQKLMNGNFWKSCSLILWLIIDHYITALVKLRAFRMCTKSMS